MILELVEHAVRNGARRACACGAAGIDPRTEQRWRAQPGGVDGRAGRTSSPPNKLSEQERQRIVDIAGSPEFSGISPKQIVPKLADRGEYVASESTFYRVLSHREPKPATPPVKHHKRPNEYVATGPCQVWAWDITYLKSSVQGRYYYLYLIVDIWSRMIVGYEVHEHESMHLSSRLLEQAYDTFGVAPGSLVLHSDNGGPMRGSTMLATLERLSVVASFSRPSVCDDNPFPEALFRTLKHGPRFPKAPFATIDAARQWVDDFVHWYNTQHLHSGINYVPPQTRHFGEHSTLLQKRHALYERARARNPRRWTRSTRNWQPVGHVRLNPRIHPRNQTPDTLSKTTGHVHTMAGKCGN